MTVEQIKTVRDQVLNLHEQLQNSVAVLEIPFEVSGYRADVTEAESRALAALLTLESALERLQGRVGAE